MEDIQIFTGVFLALTLVFLTSLWFKYGDKLAQRDHENCGNCPVHKKQNAKSTNSNSDGVQHDIHSFAKIVDTRPDDKNSIDQAFGIAVQLANAAIKHTPTETQLRLYALYKQCITGDCDRKEPSKLSMADHAKWSAWNALKGKSKLESKREYFQTVYKEIIIALKVEVKLYDTEDQVPENEKKYAKSSGQAPSMDFNVQSKLEAEEFNEELHGSPDELFNKFDLTQRDIDIDAIKQYIGTNKVQLNQRNENGTVCFSPFILSLNVMSIESMSFSKTTDVFVLCSGQ